MSAQGKSVKSRLKVVPEGASQVDFETAWHEDLMDGSGIKMGCWKEGGH